jgi:proliferating cell nuclear antigen
MDLKTIQANSFKSIFEVLKDILNDVNIYFNHDDISIRTLDTARAALVDLKLDAENFEEYKCKNECVAGINITNSFKLLKPITNNDTLSISYNPEYLSFKIENELKKLKTQFSLKLLEIDEDKIQIPEIETKVTTVMNSSEFQRICRDMTNISNEITITRENDQIIFECEGDFANQRTCIECVDNENFTGKLSGTYSLKYINLFTKSTGLCSSVQIMMEEDMRFLILKYNVANLGELKFYLATKVTTE